MLSVPLICSSSGVATVSAMVLGLAPGNCAVTTTDGGTTSGYSEIGSCSMAISPARNKAMEITPAKIGRSMKNFDRFTCVSPRAWPGVLVAGGLHPGRLSCDQRTRRQTLQSIQDHAIPGFHAGGDHAGAVH